MLHVQKPIAFVAFMAVVVVVVFAQAPYVARPGSYTVSQPIYNPFNFHTCPYMDKNPRFIKVLVKLNSSKAQS